MTVVVSAGSVVVTGSKVTVTVVVLGGTVNVTVDTTVEVIGGRVDVTVAVTVVGTVVVIVLVTVTVGVVVEVSQLRVVLPTPCGLVLLSANTGTADITIAETTIKAMSKVLNRLDRRIPSFPFIILLSILTGYFQLYPC